MSSAVQEEKAGMVEEVEDCFDMRWVDENRWVNFSSGGTSDRTDEKASFGALDLWPI